MGKLVSPRRFGSGLLFFVALKDMVHGLMVGLDEISDLFQHEWLYGYDSHPAKPLSEPRGPRAGQGSPNHTGPSMGLVTPSKSFRF